MKRHYFIGPYCIPLTHVPVVEIQSRVAHYYNIPSREMTSPSRRREYCRPRQVAMYLCRTLSRKSYPDIGHRFGGRDHTTALHAVRQIEALRKSDPDIDYEVRRLTTMLEAR